MPEETLLAFADHGEADGLLPLDGGDAQETLSRFGRVGVNYEGLAAELQQEGAQSFDRSWKDLMDTIGSKCKVLGRKP
jgi:transaldolase